MYFDCSWFVTNWSQSFCHVTLLHALVVRTWTSLHKTAVPLKYTLNISFLNSVKKDKNIIKHSTSTSNFNMCRLSYLKYTTKLDMKKKTFLHNVLPRYKCKLSKVSRENFKLAQCVLKVDYWLKSYRFSERPYIMTPFVEKISHYQYALTLILSTWPSVKVNCKLPNYKVWPIQN